MKPSAAFAVVTLCLVLSAGTALAAAQESSNKTQQTSQAEQKKLRADPCIDTKKDKKKSETKANQMTAPATKPADTTKR